MNTKQYFSDLRNTLERRNETIKTALEEYKTGAARITARYSETVASEKLTELEANTRASIVAADQAAHDEAKKAVEKLRGKLAEHITGDTALGLLLRLQAAQTFGLKLSCSEISAMAEKAGGDPVTLACLAQVAEKGGYRLNFTTSEALEQDLTSVLSMFSTPSHYTPDSLFSEGLKCHPNRMYQGVDYGRPDATALSVRMKSHKDAPGKLDAMAERWNDTGKIGLEEIAPIQ